MRGRSLAAVAVRWWGGGVREGRGATTQGRWWQGYIRMIFLLLFKWLCLFLGEPAALLRFALRVAGTHLQSTPSYHIWHRLLTPVGRLATAIKAPYFSFAAQEKRNAARECFPCPFDCRGETPEKKLKDEMWYELTFNNNNDDTKWKKKKKREPHTHKREIDMSR